MCVTIYIYILVFLVCVVCNMQLCNHGKTIHKHAQKQTNPSDPLTRVLSFCVAAGSVFGLSVARLCPVLKFVVQHRHNVCTCVQVSVPNRKAQLVHATFRPAALRSMKLKCCALQRSANPRKEPEHDQSSDRGN